MGSATVNIDVTHVSALIQHPGNGEARNAGQEFDLRGADCSVSLGDLTDDALFSWTSSIDGVGTEVGTEIASSIIN